MKGEPVQIPRPPRRMALARELASGVLLVGRRIGEVRLGSWVEPQRRLGRLQLGLELPTGQSVRISSRAGTRHAMCPCPGPEVAVRIRLRHVVHSAVVLAVVQVGFAAAFLLDAHPADRAYAALAAHHVRVPAQVIHCGRFLASPRPNTYEHACRVTYSFLGQAYYGVIPYNQPRAFLGHHPPSAWWPSRPPARRRSACRQVPPTPSRSPPRV